MKSFFKVIIILFFVGFVVLTLIMHINTMSQIIVYTPKYEITFLDSATKTPIQGVFVKTAWDKQVISLDYSLKTVREKSLISNSNGIVIIPRTISCYFISRFHTHWFESLHPYYIRESAILMGEKGSFTRKIDPDIIFDKNKITVYLTSLEEKFKSLNCKIYRGTEGIFEDNCYEEKRYTLTGDIENSFDYFRLVDKNFKNNTNSISYSEAKHKWNYLIDKTYSKSQIKPPKPYENYDPLKPYENYKP
ncbi:MAG: hypothetical protein ACKVQC_08320 [Elusimicrobiota bacterium]